MVFLVRRALENQLLLHGALPGVIVDITLLVHFTKNDFLPLFVVFLVVEGVVVGWLVGDADDGGAFGKAEVLHILVKVGVRRNPDAPAALAEIDGVQVPLQNLLLVVLLFEFQSAEYFGQLSLYGNVVLPGKVLQQLLRDGGPAVAGLHPGEHLDKSAGGPEPVDPLVLVKTLVFNRDQRLLHILRNIFIFDPDTTLVAPDGDGVLPLAGEILIPDGARFAELVVLQRKIQFRGQAGFDIIGENAGKQNSGNQQNQKNGADDAECTSEYGGCSFGGHAGCMQGTAQRAALLQVSLGCGLGTGHDTTFFRWKLSRNQSGYNS